MPAIRRWLRWLAGSIPALRLVLGERALRGRYRRLTGRAIDLERPDGLTGRLFAAMIANNRRCDPLLTRLTDKIAVRAYVAERIGARHLVGLLWHGDDPRDIPFDRLPAAFVAKTNHSCGTVLAVRGAFARDGLIDQLTRWLAENYYWRSHEAQYHDIPPAVLIEDYVGNDGASGPMTCRFWCFGGGVEIVQVDDATPGVTGFYDPAWRVLDLQYRPDRRHGDFARPARFDEMIALASRLATGFAFVRVDLYAVADAIYFSEMTFTPAAGQLHFSPPHWNRTLGEKWDAGIARLRAARPRGSDSS